MSDPLPWWSKPVLHIVRTSDSKDAAGAELERTSERSERGPSIVQRWWLPHGASSQHGAVAHGDVWRRLEGAELAAMVAQCAMTPPSFERAALRGIAHDAGRGLWWALVGAEVVEGTAGGERRRYAVAEAGPGASLVLPAVSVLVASADSHRLYVATSDYAVIEIERATGVQRMLAQLSFPVIALCRTPAGLAAWDGEHLVGINIRTAVSMRIATLTLPNVAVLAADHRGNFTLASSAAVWQCRADASGLVACELPSFVE